MAAPIQPIDINQGASFVMQFTLKDKVTTDPIDIATYKFCGAVKQTTYDDAGQEFDYTIIDAINGVVQLHLTGEQTAQLDFTNGIYDISYELVDKTIVRIVQGDVLVSLGGTAQC